MEVNLSSVFLNFHQMICFLSIKLMKMESIFSWRKQNLDRTRVSWQSKLTRQCNCVDFMTSLLCEIPSVIRVKYEISIQTVDGLLNRAHVFTFSCILRQLKIKRNTLKITFKRRKQSTHHWLCRFSLTEPHKHSVSVEYFVSSP